MTWADRINQRLTELSWSQAELARRSGVPYTTIRKYLSGGRAVKQPNNEKLSAICQALGVAPQWVIFGTGSPKVEFIERLLPVYRLGSLGEAMEAREGVRFQDRVPISRLPAPPGAGEDDVWILVEGSAMAPGIPEGAHVTFSPGAPVKPGDHVVAYDPSQNAYLIRRYRLISIANGVRTVALLANNPDFPEITFTEPGDIRIEGRVTHVMTAL